MNRSRIAAAFQVLAEEFGTPDASIPDAPAPGVTPAKRGRGRPVIGELAQATAVAAPAAVVEADPFAAEPAAPAAPTATIEEVRLALTTLRNATGNQQTAMDILKAAGGADNLTALKPDKYGAVVAAATAAMPPVKTAPVVEADPFAAPVEAAPVAEPVKVLTIEDVKAAVLAATKRAGVDRAARVVMDLGGKAKNAATGVEGPSWTALPKDQYAAAIAGLAALPTTK